jgi:hypothetical protein
VQHGLRLVAGGRRRFVRNLAHGPGR